MLKTQFLAKRQRIHAWFQPVKIGFFVLFSDGTRSENTELTHHDPKKPFSRFMSQPPNDVIFLAKTGFCVSSVIVTTQFLK